MARPKPLADLIDRCLGRTLAAQGFAASDVILAWPEIVGERLERVSQPIRLEWPRRGVRGDPEARPEPATLVVRVEGAFALELQHLAPILIERVNAYFGWRCVGRLVLKQGRVLRPQRPVKARPELAEEDRRRIRAATAAIGDESLRSALDRLGTAIAADRGRPTKP